MNFAVRYVNDYTAFTIWITHDSVKPAVGDIVVFSATELVDRDTWLEDDISRVELASGTAWIVREVRVLISAIGKRRERTEVVAVVDRVWDYSPI